MNINHNLIRLTAGIALGILPLSGLAIAERYPDRLTIPRQYECYRAAGPIKVDGKLNEKSWELAKPTEAFVDISGYGFPMPAQSTTAKMLYDDQYLYIGATINETNITGSITERDAIIYHDNDFEVFIDPDGDGVSYFEIEVNALGTVMDLSMDKPYRSGGNFLMPWNCDGLKAAVSYDGTINKSSDTDRAWFVEMAIPFKSLTVGFADSNKIPCWRINFSRVEWITKDQPEENWVWSPTGRIDMHMPERWGFLFFMDEIVGAQPSTAAELPVNIDAYRLLWAMFYAQLDNKEQKGNYIRTVKDFLLTPEDMALLPADATIQVDATKSAFDIAIDMPTYGVRYAINQDGRFGVEKIMPKVVKNWMWMRPPHDKSDAELQEWFAKIHDGGISAILFEGYDENIYRLCKEAGLEAHYWKWTMNRREFLDSHPEYYAVNRLGESGYDKPAYVDYYRFLCPSQPGIAEYLAQDYLNDANKKYVDGMHLDYVRFPDVILPVSLWANYGIEQTQELPAYDYCYCDVCREKFKAQTGRDPMDIQYPVEDNSWVNFRLDAITNVVDSIATTMHRNGKYLSGAVFPGPSMARKMVRQDWGNWSLDAYFPMIYNGFYNEGPEWIGRSVAEGVQAVGGRANVFAGIMFPDVTGDDFERALDAAYSNGASGVSFFDGPTDEYLLRLKSYLQSHNMIPAN